MRATKMISSIKHLSYIERLRYLQLPTLRYRRLRGDIIEMYKHLHEIYDNKSSLNIKLRDHSRTRGHCMTIIKSHTRYDIRKYFFVNRVLDVWNSLPESVVTAQSLNAFKNRLDKFWTDQDMRYSWEDVPAGTGDRSHVYK